jgi:hypothetical protein
MPANRGVSVAKPRLPNEWAAAEILFMKIPPRPYTLATSLSFGRLFVRPGMVIGHGRLWNSLA